MKIYMNNIYNNNEQKNIYTRLAYGSSGKIHHCSCTMLNMTLSSYVIGVGMMIYYKEMTVSVLD